MDPETASYSVVIDEYSHVPLTRCWHVGVYENPGRLNGEDSSRQIGLDRKAGRSLFPYSCTQKDSHTCAACAWSCAIAVYGNR